MKAAKKSMHNLLPNNLNVFKEIGQMPQHIIQYLITDISLITPFKYSSFLYGWNGGDYYTDSSTLYTENCILYTAHCILYTVYCILYTVHCTLYTVYCTLHTVYCTLHTAHCSEAILFPPDNWLCQDADNSSLGKFPQC